MTVLSSSEFLFLLVVVDELDLVDGTLTRSGTKCATAIGTTSMATVAMGLAEEETATMGLVEEEPCSEEVFCAVDFVEVEDFAALGFLVDFEDLDFPFPSELL